MIQEAAPSTTAGGEVRVNILVIGSGGREHALCWALTASPLTDSVSCAPGSDGIAEVATCVDIDPMDFGSLIAHCKMNDIGLVVVGPEGPLVAGLVDRLESKGIATFGPSAARRNLRAPRGSPKTCAPGTASQPRPMGVSPTPTPPTPLSRATAHPSSSRRMAWPPARASSSPRPKTRPALPSPTASPASLVAPGPRFSSRNTSKAKR